MVDVLEQTKMKEMRHTTHLAHVDSKLLSEASTISICAHFSWSPDDLDHLRARHVFACSHALQEVDERTFLRKT